ncbi:CHAT domain-containing protein [Streptomyces sp. NPDC059989]|uniref:CHAT domain-containing protein n=1 Tax=Streptomyces sp. NPDC059989 TaxID=3347026 RepID=UPI0036AEF5CE
MNAFEEALRAGNVERALEIAGAWVDEAREDEAAGSLAEALSLLARALVQANQLDEAVGAVQAGLAVDRETDANCEADLRIVLADAYSRMGELERAEEQCTLTTLYLRRIAPTTPVHPVVYANTMRHLVVAARVSELRGRPLAAVRLLDSALGLIAASNDAEYIGSAEAAAAHELLGRDHLHLVRLHRGRLARTLHDPDTAREMLGAALSAAEEAGDTESAMYAHLELAEAARDEDRPEEAMRELWRAVYLHESQSSRIRDDELRVAVRMAREELFVHGVDLAIACGDFRTAWLLAEHSRARQFRARMFGDLPPPLPDEEEEGVLLGDSELLHAGPRTATLQFFVGEGSVYGFLIGEDDTWIQVTDVAADVLNRRVARLRRLIEEPDAGEGELAAQADQLYRWLIAAHSEVIDTLDRLVVIPHGILTYLPFAMLGGDRPLLERVEVVQVPSASILNRILEREPATVRTVTVLADPHPHDDELGLPDAAEEAARIAEIFPGTVSALGSEATPDRLRAALTGYDVLHLACHATFDAHEPRSSALVLADPEDPRRPVHLTLEELIHTRTDARLAVLSGCRTGLADLAPGGELDGMVRAFLTAGAHTVIASQWRVDDEATTALMARMYRELAGGAPVGSALRTAQRAIRATPGLDHPYFWSGFVQTGDWRLTSEPN